jgi:Zn-dependent protease with chaperone function
VDASSLGLVVVAGLLTYWIHSTLLLAGAAGVEALFAIRSMRLRERLWRVALLGGVVTALAQLLLGVGNPAVRLVLGAALAEPAVAVGPPLGAAGSTIAPEVAAGAPRVPALRPPQPRGGLRAGDPAARTAGGPPGLGTVPSRAPSEPSGAGTGPAAAPLQVPGGWPAWLAFAIGGALFAALAQLGGLAAQLRRRLAGAVPLRSGPDVALLDELRRRARRRRPVRLFVAPRLGSPLSSGLLRPAIYLPPRALTELSPEEREAMLAHELAHVLRGDPAWLTLVWLFERVAFFQPLNRLARRRLVQAAEVLADDWAVRATGRHLSLASCLARIAGWMTGGPRLLGAHALRSRSQLGQRIERLLDAPARREEGRQRWCAPLFSSALLALALLAPGVAAHRPGAPEPAAVPRRSTVVPSPPPQPAIAAPHAPSVSAPPTPAPAVAGDGLAAELSGLDADMAALEEELQALARELGAHALDPALARTLETLEARTRSLAARRDQMQALTLHAIQP